MSADQAADEESGSRSVDAKIASVEGWRGEALARVRQLIFEADPEVVESVKWRKVSNPLGVPTWDQGGIICTGETYRDKIKLTFARGAALPDPSGLFNAGLDGGTRRAIDLREGAELDPAAFKALIREAIAANARAKPVRSRS
ncbi:MAG: DUF1801 domain-containing protein [Brevundimonas sp.]|nr:DUF1801 domain-containing protein [Brevundimonas sp.]